MYMSEQDTDEFGLIHVKGDQATALLDELRSEGFAGPITKLVTDQLWLYGWKVMHARLSDRGIASLGAAPGAREITSRHIEHWDMPTTRDELAFTTLERAVPGYMKRLKEGSYDPYRNTTLATFFAGFVYKCFRTVIHPKWANDLMKRQYELGRVEDAYEYLAELQVPDFAPETIERLALYLAIIRVVKKVATIEERAIMVGLLRGQTQSEIAAELGLTTKTIEHRLAALRRRAWKYRPTEIEHDDSEPQTQPATLRRQRSA